MILEAFFIWNERLTKKTATRLISLRAFDRVQKSPDVRCWFRCTQGLWEESGSCSNRKSHSRKAAVEGAGGFEEDLGENPFNNRDLIKRLVEGCILPEVV